MLLIERNYDERRARHAEKLTRYSLIIQFNSLRSRVSVRAVAGRSGQIELDKRDYQKTVAKLASVLHLLSRRNTWSSLRPDKGKELRRELSRAFQHWRSRRSPNYHRGVYFRFMISESIRASGWYVGTYVRTYVRTYGGRVDDERKQQPFAPIYKLQNLAGCMTKVGRAPLFRRPVVEFNLKLGRVVRIPPQLISRSSHTYIRASGRAGREDNVKIAA